MPEIVSPDLYWRKSSILRTRDRQILIRRLSESPCGEIVDIENTITLRSGQAFIDLMKLALYLVSNNVAEDTGIGPWIVSECQMPTNNKALKHLLRQKTPTVQAFADGLLHYASEANDEELVMTLLRSGVSPNSQCGACNKEKWGWSSSICRLRCAISAGADRAALALLQAGAHPDKCADGTSLRESYEQNLLPLAEDLLRRDVDKMACWEPISYCTDMEAENWDIFSTAILYGGIPAVEMLTKYHPSELRRIIEMDTSHAFILAASIGNETLVQSWLAEYNISVKSRAIGLCGAAANGQIKTIELLISHGSEIDGDHGSIHYCRKKLWRIILCDVTALEAALGSGQLTH